MTTNAESGPINFNTLVGRTVDFYGIDHLRFRLGPPDVAGAPPGLTTWEALEDSSDGLRSMLRDIRHVPAWEASGIFFSTPVARVVVASVDLARGDRGRGYGAVDGYELRDATTGHVWLRMGTNYSDDCYPSFVWDYQPSGEEVAPRPLPPSCGRASEPGWILAAMHDPARRRGLWYRPTDDGRSVEVCGGREGDDAHACLTAGQPVSGEAMRGLLDALEAAAWMVRSAGLLGPDEGGDGEEGGQ